MTDITPIARLVMAVNAVLQESPMATEVDGSYDSWWETSYCIYCRAEPYENPEYARAVERSVEFNRLHPKKAIKRMKVSRKNTPEAERPDWDRQHQRDLAEYHEYEVQYQKEWDNYCKFPKHNQLFNHKADCAWLELANAVEVVRDEELRKIAKDLREEFGYEEQQHSG